MIRKITFLPVVNQAAAVDNLFEIYHTDIKNFDSAEMTFP